MLIEKAMEQYLDERKTAHLLGVTFPSGIIEAAQYFSECWIIFHRLTVQLAWIQIQSVLPRKVI
jgi:hypothetical protein